MYTLFIDTTLYNVIICLYKKGKVIRREEVTDQKYNSQYIMPTIKKVLEDIKPDSIIVVNGPGSFTGVRLGVTIAKTFAFTLNIPIKTITSLEQMAVSFDNDKKIIGLNDSNGYYIGIFDDNNSLIGDYKYLTNDEFEQFNSDNNVVTNVEIDYEKVYKFLEKKEAINPHLVNPLYIKKLGFKHD